MFERNLGCQLIPFALVAAMGIERRCPWAGDKYTYGKTKR